MLPRTDIYTDFQSFTTQRAEAKQPSPEMVGQVAKQFESLFIGMMLKSMRDTLPEGGLFNSDTERMYRDMMDKQLSLNIANGQGIGLAAVIARQLSQQTGGMPTSPQPDDFSASLSLPPQPSPLKGEGAKASSGAIAFPLRGDGQTVPSPLRGEGKGGGDVRSDMSSAADGLWSNPNEFVEALWPAAVRAGKQLGVAPEVLIAQSALETGWGKQIRAQADGSPSYALFGIKADSRWQGERVNVSTLEFRHGAMQRERADFRAYGSVAEAFDDYVNFIQGNPRYREALEKGYDPKAWASELQQAGYATDPDYARKINRVQQSSALQLKVSELKLALNQPIS